MGKRGPQGLHDDLTLSLLSQQGRLTGLNEYASRWDSEVDEKHHDLQNDGERPKGWG